MAKLVAKLAITCGIGRSIHVVNSNSKQKKRHEGKFANLPSCLFFVYDSFCTANP